MTAKPYSSSMSDLPKKVVWPERALLLPPVFDSNTYEILSVQLETERLVEILLDAVHKEVRTSPFLKATVYQLNRKLINHMKNLINRKDCCPPWSVYRQTWKSLTQLKRSQVGILPGAMLHLRFLSLHILLHLQRNLLNDDLPWAPPQLILRLRFLLYRKTSGFKLSPTEGKQPLLPLWHILLHIVGSLLWCAELCFSTNYVKEEKIQGSFPFQC
jgi:hypothetical protein